MRVDAARQVAHHYARDGRAEDAVAVLRTVLDDRPRNVHLEVT